MARRYAAILALVGMSVVLIRACRHGGGLEQAVPTALTWMAILGSVGFVVGLVAASTVDEAVRAKMEQELAALLESPNQ